MGLILDSSILIAEERGKFNLPGFLLQFPAPQPLITAITASELLHGVERANDAVRRGRSQEHVEQILGSIFVQSFDLTQAGPCPHLGGLGDARSDDRIPRPPNCRGWHRLRA
jgi:hypothetical protein